MTTNIDPSDAVGTDGGLTMIRRRVGALLYKDQPTIEIETDRSPPAVTVQGSHEGARA